MFYVVGALHTKICVRDTEDGVSEWINLSMLRKLDKQGIEIRGVSKSPDANGVPFGEFKVSIKDGTSFVISKYALLTGAVLKVTDEDGLYAVDFSGCKAPCTVVLDDVCVRLPYLNIEINSHVTGFVLKLGSSIMSIKASARLSEIEANTILSRMQIDVSEANDNVLYAVGNMFLKSCYQSNLIMGDRQLMWGLYSTIFYDCKWFGGQFVVDRYFTRNILQDGDLNKRFLELYKRDLLVPEDAPCELKRKYIRYSFDIRRFVLSRLSYESFLEFVRNPRSNTRSDDFKYVRVGGVGLNSVWQFFWYGGDDIDIYNHFISSLKRMKLVD